MGSEISTFRQLKILVQELVPLDRDYLHILVGAAILVAYLIWKIAKRRQFRGHEIVGIVFFIAVVAEIMDIREKIGEHGNPNFVEGLKDTILTISVPAVAALGQLIHRKTIMFRRKNRR
jgi:hypothetical protein